jgi:hypothetical protein
MTVPGFHDIADEDQAQIRRTVAFVLRETDTPNLAELAKKTHNTPEELWARLCELAGLSPCRMPVYIQVAGDPAPSREGHA